VNDELERMWKEAVMAEFKVLSWNLPGRTEENHEKTSVRITSLVRYLNHGPSEYEAGVLTIDGNVQ
jgi:surfactin synthase thioesterase subunit